MHLRSLLAAASIAAMGARFVLGCSGFSATNEAVDAGATEVTPDAAPATGVEDAATSPGYREAIIADRPLVYWRMDRLDVSKTVVDELGTANTLTLLGTGHTLAPGPSGKSSALRFDGTSSYARANDSSALTFAGESSYSVELGARREASDGGTFKHLVGHVSGFTDATHGYLVYANVTASPPELGAEHDVPDAQASIFAHPLFPTDVWTHIVLAFDASTSFLALYVDGVEHSRTSVVGRLAARPASAFVVGRDLRADRTFWPGALAEIAVYPRALSFADVVRHHKLMKATAGP